MAKRNQMVGPAKLSEHTPNDWPCNCLQNKHRRRHDSGQPSPQSRDTGMGVHLFQSTLPSRSLHKMGNPQGGMGQACA